MYLHVSERKRAIKRRQTLACHEQRQPNVQHRQRSETVLVVLDTTSIVRTTIVTIHVLLRSLQPTKTKRTSAPRQRQKTEHDRAHQQTTIDCAKRSIFEHMHNNDYTDYRCDVRYSSITITQYRFDIMAMYYANQHNKRKKRTHNGNSNQPTHEKRSRAKTCLTGIARWPLDHP